MEITQPFLYLLHLYSNLNAPITTAADNKFCDIYPDFRRNKA